MSRTYRYKRWSGGERTIDNIDDVEFTATHVLFKRYRKPDTWSSGYFIVLAEREMQVNELREVEA